MCLGPVGVKGEIPERLFKKSGIAFQNVNVARRLPRQLGDLQRNRGPDSQAIHGITVGDSALWNLAGFANQLRALQGSTFPTLRRGPLMPSP